MKTISLQIRRALRRILVPCPLTRPDAIIISLATYRKKNRIRLSSVNIQNIRMLGYYHLSGLVISQGPSIILISQKNLRIFCKVIFESMYIRLEDAGC